MSEEGKRIARETGRPFHRTNNLIQSGSRDELMRVLGLYESSDLILTSRLHGCILGLAAGRKVLAVSGDRKMESFMEAAGLRGWVLGLEEIHRLPNLLRALSAQEVPSRFIEDTRDRNREIGGSVRALAQSLESAALGQTAQGGRPGGVA
jgi:polysaccharide pyruvyl transferase WcaK-like protein